MKYQTKQRVAPLTFDECNEEQKELLGPWKLPDGTVPNLIMTFVRHPDLLTRWFPYGMHVMQKSTVPERHRELIIMRVSWLNKSNYEWGHHANISKRIGITDEELTRVTKGPNAPGWTPFEQLLLRAVDELKHTSALTDETYDALSKEYDFQQMIDVIHTFGAYNMVSMSLNIFGIELEEGVEGIEKYSG